MEKVNADCSALNYGWRRSKSYTAVIFDLGDVLFTWSPSTPKSPLPANVLRNILRCYHWFEYEKRNLGEQEVYGLVAQEFKVSAADVKAAFEAARDSLQSNPEMLEIIRELKRAGLVIYAMSNISAPDWEVLSTKATPEEWALFNHTFTSHVFLLHDLYNRLANGLLSAAAGERKPNIGFFKHVIEEAKIDPSSTIFVDDKLENVLTARSFGMHGIVFDDQSKVIQELKNLCFDPVMRGSGFLASHKRNLISVTSTNIQLSEVRCRLIAFSFLN